MPNVTILGAGPAGLAAAWRLVRRRLPSVSVTVIERERETGGLCRSFQRHDIRFDMGSHRLHPACRPDILQAVRDLLGGDLLERRRNGRICLDRRFLKFPPSLIDLVSNGPPGFVAGLAKDTLANVFRPRAAASSVYRDVLLARMGPTLCERFYFPYTRKLWGVSPDQLSARQADLRMRRSGLKGVLVKVLNTMSKPVFHYPRGGIGQIMARITAELEQNGVTVLRGAEAIGVAQDQGKVAAVRVRDENGSIQAIPTDLLFSTIPLTTLNDCLKPDAVRNTSARDGLEWRSLVLLYLVLPVDRFTPYDAHYVPEEAYGFTRLSEPKRYSASLDPAGKTGLCFEIPCGADDPRMKAPLEALVREVTADLERIGLPLPARLVDMFRLAVPYAYPVYRLGYEAKLDTLLNEIARVRRVISFGRNGLFVHDNLHHAMAMGFEAADCVGADGSWDDARWRQCLESFRTFAVED